ncbi:hypothetical protein EI94DRAFT_1805789 [Lactarius quietus]|nr:hypothetical protein EI94DRAFT_1805789 [Lactarius quietus]
MHKAARELPPFLCAKLISEQRAVQIARLQDALATHAKENNDLRVEVKTLKESYPSWHHNQFNKDTDDATSEDLRPGLTPVSDTTGAGAQELQHEDSDTRYNDDGMYNDDGLYNANGNDDNEMDQDMTANDENTTEQGPGDLLPSNSHPGHGYLYTINTTWNNSFLFKPSGLEYGHHRTLCHNFQPIFTTQLKLVKQLSHLNNPSQ